MNTIWIITKRELKSFFDSLIAYIMLILFLSLSGLFTWLFGSDVFFVGQASLQAFFGVAYWTLFLFIPAITMRTLAEERRMGTIELLLTKSITDRQVVFGKFFAVFLLIAIALLLTLPYLFTVANIGNLDTGATLCGYMGLLLMSGVYISIGLFASSSTNNQIVAFLIALSIGAFFHIIFGVLSGNMSGWISKLFNYMSISGHFENIVKGVVDTKDLVYFASLIVLGLFLTEINIARRNVS